MSILLLIKKRNWIQNTGWYEFVFIKETKTKKKIKRIRSPGCWGEDQEMSETSPKTLKTKLAVSECGLSGAHTERIEEEENKKVPAKKTHKKSGFASIAATNA